MSKVKLELELDIPGIENFSDGELAQLIFDEYINFVTVSHLEDASRWCCKSQQNPEDVSAKQIWEMHNTWADISKAAQKTVKIERRIDEVDNRNGQLEDG